MTGRAAGYCAGSTNPRYLNRGPRFGFGRRWARGGGRGWGGGGRGWGGGGRGWRYWFYATGLTGWQRTPVSLPAFDQPMSNPVWSTQTELHQRRQQAEFLQKTLDGVQQRINQLAAEGSNDQANKPGSSA